MSAASPEVLEAVELVGSLNQGMFTPPTEQTKIYKDECAYCFHTPFFPGGLYVCLQSYCCFCARHVLQYAESTGRRLFVQVESKKVSVAMETESGEPKDKITKLAIGVDSGFDNQKFELEDTFHLVLYPELHRRAKIVKELGDNLFATCDRVISSISAERMEMLQNASNAWDGELKQVTKHADLKQLDNGKKIPLSGWKCDECELTENLWLNLTDGAIRCGRSQYVSEGQMSKGNNHMKAYYEVTGFPLVVKLGTISKDGAGDVFSYDEDDAVIDPNLERHLAHFGLDPALLEKTEKSTLELELDMNQKWEWAKCQEDGASLENIYGPGYTGLINIGSSCYMNSVLQALLMVPEVRKRFAEDALQTMAALPPTEVHGDFNAQVSKVFAGMMSGDYAQEDSPLNGIKPKQFKRVVAGNHAEFSSARQQDAEEYVRHILDKISTNTPAGAIDPSLALKFQMETRFEDLSSGGVRYSDREETVLSLPVREELLTPLEGEENVGRFAVDLKTLIDCAFAPDVIEGFKSPVTGEVKGASNTIRFKTFPDFLLVQIQKFTLTPEYTVKKIDMDLKLEDSLDVSCLRGSGLKANEHLLPEDAQAPPEPRLPDYDQGVVQQLEQMGFSRNASVKAAIEVKPRGGNAETALEWLMVRLDDPSINEAPVPSTSAPSVDRAAAAQRPCVQELVNFGFSVHQATHALSKFPDANAAAEWLFEHADEVPPEETQPATPPVAAQPKQMRDGDGRYRLIGLISHMGSSPHSGHYVAHVYKDGKWILFNDEKVAVSQNPPKQLAYLYLYQRI